MRYEIVEGRSEVSMFHKPTWWSVVAYNTDENGDETCLGGDTHWVRRELAEAARDAYESGELAHGAVTTETSQKVVALAKAAGWTLTYEESIRRGIGPVCAGRF